MSDNPPGWAVQRNRRSGGSGRVRWDAVWLDVSALVQGQSDYDQRDLEAGTYVEVTYKGDNHRVYVGDPLAPRPACWARRGWGRYVYRGNRYKSLSAVARVITGDDNLSGNRFFKLRRRRRGGAR